MKKTFIICLLLSCFSLAYAKHITGGEMIYDFISSNGNSKTYRITLQLFRDENCFNCAPMPPNVALGIYNSDNNQLIGGYQTISINSSQLLPQNPLPPCIVNPPSLSYRVGYYSFTIQLPNNSNGYTVTYQTCCRIDGIRNIGTNIGATYTCHIPGTNTLGALLTDNSPRFSKGISVVCFNKPFILDFSATDPDGDELVYSLCSGYTGGAAVNANYNTPGPPPYPPLNYTNGYSGNSPLGPAATINAQTGIISGIAPDAGKYVVSVCVSSYRNGLYLGTHRKDFIISVNPCDFAGAELLPEYINCDTDSAYTFENRNQSPLNLTFYWDFGDPASGANNISTSATPTHIYSDTGIYILKFVVNRGDPCADSTYSRVKVFPGYFPAMDNTSPRCKNTPVQFSDLTIADYGEVNNWHWNFGNPATLADTSGVKNPIYVYPTAGTYIASLNVESSKGCKAIIYDTVTIVNKPPLTVTNDTLICSVDDLQLFVSSNLGGSVTWSPNYNINNVNSFTPIVAPDVTTTYHVAYSDNFGCTATESVLVRVVDTVTLKTGPDTTICRTDRIILSINSDALKYVWTELPAGNTLNNTLLKNPVAKPVAVLTTYYVKGNIGSCIDFDSIKVKTVPYPVAKAGKDTMICFGTSAYLHATGGSSYSWNPSTFLNNAFAANPVSVNPQVDVNYIVTVRDTLGCPKPVNDTMLVDVERIFAEAGPRDTSVVINQPLQLTASGSIFYSWTTSNEPSWLSNPNIYNPVSLPLDNIEYVVTVSNAIGCFGTDTIYVKLFKLDPDLYVPTGFSPNGDGTNDILKPLALGLRAVNIFSIYNRWGQLVFTTSQIGSGWDGKFGGSEQGPGTYVWLAEGTDYRNKKIKRKGSVVLIR